MAEDSDSSSSPPPQKKLHLDKAPPVAVGHSLNHSPPTAGPSHLHSPQCSRTPAKPVNQGKELTQTSPASQSVSPNKCKFHAKNKFVPREDLVNQIMEMGICRNGATKALFWTGNKSVLAASNWIFDQPERDLDTPLEDELEMIRAQQLERAREEKEKEEIHRMCQKVTHSHVHHHHHHHTDESFDSDDMDELHEEDEMDEEDEDEEDEEYEEEEEDETEFKMVFVINRSLDLTPGQMSLFVSRATAGLCRKINSQAQSVTVGPDELAMWGDLGEKTVILWADSEQHIKDLELMGRSLQLPSYMMEGKEGKVLDVSTRGVEGAVKAVLGIFGEEKEVNKVTGRLKIVS